jgi:hypothetical protein
MKNCKEFTIRTLDKKTGNYDFILTRELTYLNLLRIEVPVIGGLSMIIAKEHDRIYEDFVRDIRNNADYPFIRLVEEYSNQEIIKFCPSQHENATVSQQRKISTQWQSFLLTNKLLLKEVQVCTRLDQSIFDALCEQSSIESLRIKWLACKEIRNITKLIHLKKLFIESGSCIEDITPVAELKNLETLILGETVKVSDYSCLKNITSLKVLGICAYQTHYYTKIHMDSSSFIEEMNHLEYVDLIDTVVN